MTDEEMTALDVWIAINLFGYRWTDHPDDSTIDDVKQVWITEKSKKCIVSHTWQYDIKHFPNDRRFNHSWNDFQPTRLSRDAFDVLRKCNELITKQKRRNDIVISMVSGNPMVSYPSETGNIGVIDETLEMAICVFARIMFEVKPKTSLDETEECTCHIKPCVCWHDEK
jgi:hypothetical protein